MHEVAVIAAFLVERDEDVAVRYRDHEVVEARRAALDYQSNRPVGFRRIPKSEIAALDRQFDEVKRKYGVEFLEPNGWAADTLNKRRVKFRDIEAVAKLHRWRPYYRMASHGVHANMKGLTTQLGAYDSAAAPIGGASNYGLADPGQSGVTSLTQVTAALVAANTSLDSLVALEALTAITDRARDEFVSTQWRIEDRERKRANRSRKKKAKRRKK